MQNALRALPGVVRAEVSFPEHKARVWGPVSPATLIGAVEVSVCGLEWSRD